MSRTARIATVVRVRRLQARMAEIETVRRRTEAERHRDVRDDAVETVRTRSAAQVGTVSTIHGLVHGADLLRGAANHVTDCTDLVAIADRATSHAEADWLAAHRRQDAVERLADRHQAAALLEQTRTEQKELDDLVSVRHGREGAFS